MSLNANFQAINKHFRVHPVAHPRTTHELNKVTLRGRPSMMVGQVKKNDGNFDLNDGGPLHSFFFDKKLPQR